MEFPSKRQDNQLRFQHLSHPLHWQLPTAHILSVQIALFHALSYLLSIEKTPMSWTQHPLPPIPSSSFMNSNRFRTTGAYPTAPHAPRMGSIGTHAMPVMSAPVTMQIILIQTPSGWEAQILPSTEVRPMQPPPSMAYTRPMPEGTPMERTPRQNSPAQRAPPTRRPRLQDFFPIQQTPTHTHHTQTPTQINIQNPCPHCSTVPKGRPAPVKEVRFAPRTMGASTHYRRQPSVRRR